MNSFDTGGFRRTMIHAESAEDLVRRTLAQHGLMGPGAPRNPQARPAGPVGGTARPDHFTCAAGSREFLTHVPASAQGGAAGLIMMLHGCTQTPADFAAGTDMNALAERHRLVIVYPQQSRGDNAQSCWNWFSRGDQTRDRGEPAILAGLARQVGAAHQVPEGKIFVAGLSAGAAMAVILGQTHPEIFAAVGAHSGLAYGAARDVPSAFAAMAGNASTPARSDGQPTPTITFHGLADHTVNPANADHINSDVLAAGPELTLFNEATKEIGGRKVSLETTTTADGAPLLESWKINGLGHAWSGGKSAGSFTDPSGPDASAEMVRFFLSVKPSR